MKLNKNLISIIIPVFNRHDMIRRCIKSLISQTYKKVELIFVDDGSTDNSLSILREYEQLDTRVKIFSQVNKGPAAARNLGVANATGEYLMFCDSDDEYLPIMCEEMLKSITINQVDLVMCNADILWGDALIENQLSEKRFKHIDKYCNSIKEDKIIHLDKSKPKMINVLLWNKIFKHEIIINNQIAFPEGCEHDDDYFTYLYSLFIDKYFILNKSLYKYYINNNSIIDLFEQGKPKNKYDLFKICCYLFDFLKQKDMLDSCKLSLKKFIFDKISMIKIELFTQEELIELSKQFNKKFKELGMLCSICGNQLMITDVFAPQKKIFVKLFVRALKTFILTTKKYFKTKRLNSFIKSYIFKIK